MRRLSHPWAVIALNRAIASPILVTMLLVGRVSLDPPTLRPLAEVEDEARRPSSFL